MQIAVVYVAVELDVFKELVKTSHSIAVLELAEKSKASPNLLGKYGLVSFIFGVNLAIYDQKGSSDISRQLVS